MLTSELCKTAQKADSVFKIHKPDQMLLTLQQTVSTVQTIKNI